MTENVPAALRAYRATWQRKPALRAVYDDFYGRIAAACTPGLTIELGGGVGNLKDRLGRAIVTDIQFAPWLDAVADAQRLPFGAETIANIVMVDVFHHLEFPLRFLREAKRVLRPGGRIVMVEPAITWGSTVFYRFIHHEPVRMSADVLRDGEPNPGRDPYDANQAFPTLLATRDRERLRSALPELRVARVEWFALAAYGLTGGFKSWSLVSERIARRLLRIEHHIEPTVGRFAGFRLLLVIEKAN